MVSSRRRRIGPLGGVAMLVVAAVAGAGLYFFEPWRLVTSSNAQEALPASASDLGLVARSEPAPVDPPSPIDPPVPPAGPVVLAEGAFVSQEHGTEGIARVLQLPDGTRFVRFEGLATSDGPDLRVILSEQDAGGDWFKYADGRSVELGELTATHGEQNYAIAPDVDLDGLNSVVIWCDRFSVAFGSAPLRVP